MKKYLILIITAICLLATACAAEAPSPPSAETLSVFRIIEPQYRSDGKLIEAEQLVPDTSENPIIQAAEALSSSPQDEKLKSAIPFGVSILDTELDNNCVNIYVNTAYLDISGIEKTELDACLTLTMCSIEGVDCVSVSVGSEVIEENLSVENYLLFDNIISPGKAQVRVYFPKADKHALGSEYRTISYNDENSIERGILDKLFEGPTDSSLIRAFPLGTIILSVYTQDGVCSVSLSGIDPSSNALTTNEAELAVYSIVNSLTTFSDIKSVQLLIDGERVQELWGYNIYSPLTRNESIIGSVVSG